MGTQHSTQSITLSIGFKEGADRTISFPYFLCLCVCLCLSLTASSLYLSISVFDFFLLCTIALGRICNYWILVKRGQIPSWVESETIFPDCPEVTESLIFLHESKNPFLFAAPWNLMRTICRSHQYHVLTLVCDIFYHIMLLFFSNIKNMFQFLAPEKNLGHMSNCILLSGSEHFVFHLWITKWP